MGTTYALAAPGSAGVDPSAAATTWYSRMHPDWVPLQKGGAEPGVHEDAADTTGVGRA
jgi:hypothetical protein